jgi:hypothetical protein
MAYVFLGTILFANWEGWNYLDGAYFCFISLVSVKVKVARCFWCNMPKR